MENIQAINKIVSPYFEFNVIDIYGDRGSCDLPKIEELSTIYFKLKTIRGKSCSKEQREELADKVRELNIGDVDLIKIEGFGIYMSIKIYEDINYVLK